jgi:hypothetical protein
VASRDRTSEGGLGHHLLVLILRCSFNGRALIGDRCTIGSPFKTSVELYLALHEKDCEKSGIGTPHCNDLERKVDCPSVQV